MMARLPSASPPFGDRIFLVRQQRIRNFSRNGVGSSSRPESRPSTLAHHGASVASTRSRHIDKLPAEYCAMPKRIYNADCNATKAEISACAYTQYSLDGQALPNSLSPCVSAANIRFSCLTSSLIATNRLPNAFGHL